jgi:hypothetical protein
MTDIIESNIIIINLDNCIICDKNDPIILKFKGSCICQSYIHVKCIDEWFIKNPLTCPTCKVKYYFTYGDRCAQVFIILVIIGTIIFLPVNQLL